jgi:hypothetical protein
MNCRRRIRDLPRQSGRSLSRTGFGGNRLRFDLGSILTRWPLLNPRAFFRLGGAPAPGGSSPRRKARWNFPAPDAWPRLPQDRPVARPSITTAHRPGGGLRGVGWPRPLRCSSGTALRAAPSGAVLCATRSSFSPSDTRSPSPLNISDGRELKAAEDIFELAKNANSPFLQAYYRRVGERYLSSQGELKPAERRSDAAADNLMAEGT